MERHQGLPLRDEMESYLKMLTEAQGANLMAEAVAQGD